MGRQERPGDWGSALDVCRECLSEAELCDGFCGWRIERVLDRFFPQRRARAEEAIS